MMKNSIFRTVMDIREGFPYHLRDGGGRLSNSYLSLWSSCLNSQLVSNQRLDSNKQLKLNRPNITLALLQSSPAQPGTIQMLSPDTQSEKAGVILDVFPSLIPHNQANKSHQLYFEDVPWIQLRLTPIITSALDQATSHHLLPRVSESPLKKISQLCSCPLSIIWLIACLAAVMMF